MNYSINEIKLSLQSQFDNSADLSVRVFTLKSALKIQAAVITMEGLVDKEQLSQSVLNPLLTFDYGARDSAAVSVIAYSSVMASSDVIKLSSADEIVTYITSGFAVLMMGRGAIRRRRSGLQLPRSQRA